MQFITTLAIALIAATRAAADFQIYGGQSNDWYGAAWGYYFFPSEPDCDMAVNHAIWISMAVNDLSSTDGAACDGCDIGQAVADWNITRFEMHDDSDNWGHFTIYQDGGYVLEPADGSATRGTCYRDNGDDFNCFDIGSESGVRLFTCTSDLVAPFYKY